MSFPFPSPGFGSSEEEVVVGTHVIDVDSVSTFITNPLTSDDELSVINEFVGELIDEVWAEFVARTKQPIDPDAAYIYPFRGKGKAYHVPPLRVVNGISKLEYFNGSDWVECETTSYRGDDSDGFFLIDADFVMANGSRYRATLDVGYSENEDGTLDLPGTIVSAIKYMTILRLYDSDRGGGRFGLASKAESSGGMTATTSYTRKEVEAMWERAIKSQMPL